MNATNAFAMGTAARLPNVLSANGHTAGVRRAAEAASALSLRNVYHARAKLMQQSVERFVDLVYERMDETVMVWANVDRDGRILISSPWSGKNYRRYGLRRTEADALRWEMHMRSDPALVDPPLFYYEAEWRSWFVNFHAYPTVRDAITHLGAHPITWWVLHGYAARSRTVAQHVRERSRAI